MKSTIAKTVALLFFFVLPSFVYAQNQEQLSLAFGTVTVPSTQTVSFGPNYSTSTYQLCSITSPSPFSLVTEASSVGPGGNFYAAVLFDPSVAGTYTDAIDLNYSSSTCPYGVSLTLQINASGTYTPTLLGAIDPKYVVLSVQYAPPGAKSFADYGTSTNQGTSTSMSSLFSTSNVNSVSVGIFKTDDIFGIDGSNVPSGGITATYSTTNTTEQDTSSSIAFNKMTSYDTQVLGPASNSVGLDHNNDTVTIWLNPVFEFTNPTPTSALFTAVYWDTLDGCDPVTQTCNGTPGMDTITLQVAQLLNPALITDQYQLNQLARSWAPTQADGTSPGLTDTDLLAIAGADPYTNASFNPTFTIYNDGTCSNASAGIAAGRFCLTTSNQVEYAGPQQGGQNGPTVYKQSYTVTAMEAKGGKDTHSTTYSVDANADGGWLAWFTVDIKISKTLTWTNQWSTATSSVTSTGASTTITPPGYSDNYQGPTEFAIYQDSVYGTFMYLPIVFPGWLLSATPASQTVTQGNSTTFTVATTASDGGTGTVSAFTVTGLPTGATATFSPTSVSVGGSSTVTVKTTTSTPAGTYTLTISGAIGTNLAHSVQVNLVVKAAPGFSITASPASQTVTAGAKTTYTVSTTALNGFTGSIALQLAGLPTGATGTFNPTSITGTGSSTLTVTTSSTTPTGSHTLTITGVSGSITHTHTVTLVVASSTANFTIAVSPGSAGIKAGSSASFTVSTTAVNGFTGVIALTLAGLPTGATKTFTPTSITGTGSSTLKVSTATTTPVGTYTLTVTGTSGSLIHTAVVTLTVN